jgi:hypothetical protein
VADIDASGARDIKDLFRNQVDLTVRDAPGRFPPATMPANAVLDLDARDRVQRERVSVEHRYDDLNGLWFQKAESRVYVQDADTRQFAAEDRNTSVDRTRDNRHREKIVGHRAALGRAQARVRRRAGPLIGARQTHDDKDNRPQRPGIGHGG